MIDFRELVRLGAHFGHIKRRLHPKMNRYIWGVKNDVHLIDVSKTAQLIERSVKFLESVAAEGKTILWVGTKKPAQAVIYEVAQKLNMPYVNHRWIGGTLSNFSQVKKSVTKLLHYEDILAKSEKLPFYTKKEMNSIAKMVERLKKNIGGIKDLSWPIGAVVLVDVIKEGSAMREARTVGVPVVALVDTNSDPSLVDYVIPINDDSARVIKYVVDHLGDAALKGQKNAKEIAKKAKEEAAAKAAEKKLKAAGEKKAVARKTIEKKEVKKAVASVSAKAFSSSANKPMPRLRPTGATEDRSDKKKVAARPAAKPAMKKEVAKAKPVDKKPAAKQIEKKEAKPAEKKVEAKEPAVKKEEKKKTSK